MLVYQRVDFLRNNANDLFISTHPFNSDANQLALGFQTQSPRNESFSARQCRASWIGNSFGIRNVSEPTLPLFDWLVDSTYPSEKYEFVKWCQMRVLFPIYGNIINVPNHQPIHHLISLITKTLRLGPNVEWWWTFPAHHIFLRSPSLSACFHIFLVKTAACWQIQIQNLNGTCMMKSTWAVWAWHLLLRKRWEKSGALPISIGKTTSRRSKKAEKHQRGLVGQLVVESSRDSPGIHHGPTFSRQRHVKIKRSMFPHSKNAQAAVAKVSCESI